MQFMASHINEASGSGVAAFVVLLFFITLAKTGMNW